MNGIKGNMRYLPDDHDLLKGLGRASVQLSKKLSAIDHGGLGVSKWGLFNLSLNSMDASLKRYSYILAWCIESSDKDPDEIVFLDYGGGSGLMSLLAKEFGIGTVIFNDIYDIACSDAKAVGDAAGLTADHYICGDIDSVISYIRKKNISCSAIGSYDVIEHIYDIESYISKLKMISDDSLKIVMSSGANEANPFIRRAIVKRQRQIEEQGRGIKVVSRDCDRKESYISIRKKIIREYAAGLEDLHVERLAMATRGKVKNDIIKDVDAFMSNKRYPEPLLHPTNTCDPNSGYWEEHFMDPYYLKRLLSKQGFVADIMPGYWNVVDTRLKLKVLARDILNNTIDILGERSLIISPFYTILAKR